MGYLFNHYFKNLDDENLNHLKTLQYEGCIYTEYLVTNENKIKQCRITLTPAEIVEWVEATKAYDEFLGYYEEIGYADEALDMISNSKIRQRVIEHNEDLSINNLDCCHYEFVGFLGKPLEILYCGGRGEERYEVLATSYTRDRRFLLQEILEIFPQSSKVLSNRGKALKPMNAECEHDVRDLLYMVLKCVFPDAIKEESTPSHASSSKRIDIVIPKIDTVLEIKYVRDKTHAKRVIDEIKIDIESYHSHPLCQTLVIYIWDENRFILDRHNVISDLRGRRIKNGSIFDVDVKIVP